MTSIFSQSALKANEKYKKFLSRTAHKKKECKNWGSQTWPPDDGGLLPRWGRDSGRGRSWSRGGRKASMAAIINPHEAFATHVQCAHRVLIRFAFCMTSDRKNSYFFSRFLYRFFYYRCLGFCCFGFEACVCEAEAPVGHNIWLGFCRSLAGLHFIRLPAPKLRRHFGPKRTRGAAGERPGDIHHLAAPHLVRCRTFLARPGRLMGAIRSPAGMEW